jgi:hypothetical protein
VISHVPVSQVVMAFDSAQSTPHPPQFASVSSPVSHPFVAAPSQSPHPESQLSTVHELSTHDSVACASEHEYPHAPQLAVSVAVCTSHPGLDALQSAKPGSHAVTTQRPAPLHRPIPLGKAHMSPQAAQLSTLPSTVSHPFEGSPSQSAKESRHAVNEQAPAEHSPTPFAQAQVTPQAPQLLALERDASQPFAELPSQSSRPASHAMTSQVPVAQEASAVSGGSHASPHNPQWASSERLCSQPSDGSSLQSAYPTRQDATVQTPPAQLPPALAGAHSTPQAPQSLAVSRDVSHPFAGLPSQSS